MTPSMFAEKNPPLLYGPGVTNNRVPFHSEKVSFWTINDLVVLLIFYLFANNLMTGKLTYPVLLDCRLVEGKIRILIHLCISYGSS